MKREPSSSERQQPQELGVVPGLIMIGLLILLRLLGFLQPLEWGVLDWFLRLRLAEPTDEKILIVGIDEKDIQASTYPIPDAKLAALIEKLQIYQPRAVGIDIVRNKPVPPGHDQFTQVLQQYDNVFGIEKALPDDRGLPLPQIEAVSGLQILVSSPLRLLGEF